MNIGKPQSKKITGNNPPQKSIQITPLRVVGLLLALGLVFSAGFFFHRNRLAPKILVAADDVITEIQDELENEILLYTANGLETIYLDIPFDSLQSIEEKRNEALQVGILLASDEDYVPASLRFLDQSSINIKLRLKGDWTDHLKGEKWSFRVHLQDQQGNVMGMRRFSLQAPETRSFLWEWVLHQLFLREGILTTRYHFVNVLINGEHKGIYALEESFSTELLESQDRRDGIIFRYDEDMVWENRAQTRNGNPVFLVTDPDTADITIFREGRIYDNDALSSQAQKAIRMLESFQTGQADANEVFDVKLFGKYFALTDLWKGNHGTIWHNMRYYYNPVTGLIEPIGFDNSDYTFSEDNLANISDDLSIFSSTLIREAYARQLSQLITKGSINELQAEIGSDYDLYFTALENEYGAQFTNRMPWIDIAGFANELRTELHPITLLYGSYKWIQSTDSAMILQVNLFNSFILPLELTRISIDSTPLEMTTATPDRNTHLERWEPYPLLNFYSSGSVQPDQILLPTNLANEPHPDEIVIRAEVRIAGLTTPDAYYEIILTPEWSNFERTITSVPQRPDILEALETHSFLRQNNTEKTIYTVPGIWQVSGDLIVPKGYLLEISPGTTLHFEEDAILFSDGSPIHILGMQELPVILDSQNSTWGGVIVLNSEQASIWNWVSVNHTSSINRDGWITTGGITFYQSPIQINQSYISTSTAEDALNVISSEINLFKTVFSHTPSDAFDGDFVTGTMIRSTFEDIGGDAVDLSGSVVEIRHISFVNVGDKALSAGERSFVSIEYFDIDRVGVGIASKDFSDVTLFHGDINAARVAALVAYNKKAEFGPGSILAEDTILDSQSNVICQTGSSIKLNDDNVNCMNYDLGQLNELGVLGN
jgi:hypothetical protein